MVTNFDVVNIGPVLTEMGIVWQERQLADGRSFIAASIGAALSFNIVPAACLGSDGKSNCVGANLITLFTGGSPNPQSVSAFNDKLQTAGAWVFAGGLKSTASATVTGSVSSSQMVAAARTADATATVPNRLRLRRTKLMG